MSGNGMEYLKTPEEVAAFDLSQQQQADIHELQQQNTELQAHVEVLVSHAQLVYELSEAYANGDTDAKAVYRAGLQFEAILSQTPKQSLAHIIEQAHMAGQADAGVDPSHSNAQLYSRQQAKDGE